MEHSSLNTWSLRRRCRCTSPASVILSLHAPARIVGVGTYPPNSEEVPLHYFHNFSSYHPQGTHFLAGDGSVHMVSNDIDMDVYQALCTRAEGDSVGSFFSTQ